MIYKTLKKVSDYCQLLDKSKLPNTQTVNGITYTVDKVNGTITANGTATAESDYKADIALNNAESYTNGGGTKIPSRLLFLGCPIGGSQTTYGLYNNWVSSGVVDTGNGGITDTTSDKYYEYYRFNLRITIKQGYTANNLTFKPQLFDLTEMYGSGNEPATVEEFKSKFPNDLYDYSPRCFITSYKDCLKVSDVCQLLDKSKYPATKTVNGVTFTNNGDGTITVNGTAEEEIYYNIQNIGINRLEFSINIHLNSNHIREIRNNILFEYVGYDKKNGLVFFHIQKGGVCENIVAKPQIFDLTEMYGSGNEPTTVEQFKADFPNELYDYKPYSLVPSYKKSLICTTKNLIPYPYYDTTNTNAGVTFTDNGDGSITVNGTPTGPAIFYLTDYVYKAGVFTVSGISSYINLAFGVDFFNSDLTFISEIDRSGSFTFDTSTYSDFACFRLYVKRKENGVEINNYTFKPMLELGDTATEYHPYGYL